MRAVLVLAAGALAGACTYQLDSARNLPADANTCQTSLTGLCMTASPSFTWLTTNVFARNCSTSVECHKAVIQGTSLKQPTGMVALGAATTNDGPPNDDPMIPYQGLMGSDGMGVMSVVDSTRKLVIPGNPAQSWLAVMIHAIDPSQADPPATSPEMLTDNNGKTIGYMPQQADVLCCQKLDAITTWIQQGALLN